LAKKKEFITENRRNVDREIKRGRRVARKRGKNPVKKVFVVATRSHEIEDLHRVTQQGKKRKERSKVRKRNKIKVAECKKKREKNLPDQ